MCLKPVRTNFSRHPMPLKPVAGAAARYMDVVEVQRRELNSWTARRGDSAS